MASRLLNVLKTIEDGRQDCIEVLKGKGYQLSDSSTFNDIAAACATLDENVPFDTFEPGFTTDYENDPEIYIAPGGTPDILAYANNIQDIEYDGVTYVPTSILLIERNQDVVKFAESINSPSSSNKFSKDIIYYNPKNTSYAIQYRRRLAVLSDGEIIDLTNNSGVISHEWDTSKDIIMNGVHYAYITFYHCKITNKNYLTVCDPSNQILFAPEYTKVIKILLAPVAHAFNNYLGIIYDAYADFKATCWGLAEFYIADPLTPEATAMYNLSPASSSATINVNGYASLYSQSSVPIPSGGGIIRVRDVGSLYSSGRISIMDFKFNNMDLSNLTSYPASSNMFESKYLKVRTVPANLLASVDQFASASRPVKYLIITDTEAQELITGTGFPFFNNLIYTNIFEHLKINIPTNSVNYPFKQSFGRYSSLTLPLITTLGCGNFRDTNVFSINLPGVLLADTSYTSQTIEGYMTKLYLPNCTQVINGGGDSGGLVPHSVKYLDLRKCTSFSGNLTNYGSISSTNYPSRLQLVRLDSLSNITSPNMFRNCRSLRYVYWADNIKGSINLSTCVCLTTQCILDLFEKCATLEEGEEYTITLPTNVYLNPAHLNSIKSKGWVINNG